MLQSILARIYEETNRWTTILLLMTALLVTIFLLHHRYLSKADNDQEHLDLLTEQLHTHPEMVMEKAEIVLAAVKDQGLEGVWETFAEDGKAWYRQQGLVVALYQHGELVFWTENATVLPFRSKLLEAHGPVQFLSNGWYLVEQLNEGEFSVFTLLLIKHEYEHQNEFLKNGVNPIFSDVDNFNVTLNPGTSYQDIHDAQGAYLFSVQTQLPDRGDQGRYFVLVCLLELMVLILLLRLVKRLVTHADWLGALWVKAGLLLLVLVVIRALMLRFHFPPHWYQLNWFRPEHLALSELSPSLGDLLANLAFGFYWVYNVFAMVHVDEERLATYGARRRTALLIGAIVVIVFSVFAVPSLIHSLLSNSTINFDLSAILELGANSYFAILAIVIVWLTQFVAINKLIYLCRCCYPSSNRFVFLYFLVFGIFYALYVYFDWEHENAVLLWSTVLVALIYLHHRKGSAVYSYVGILTLLVIYGLNSALMIEDHNHRTYLKERMLLGKKLTINRDAIAEHLFFEIAADIRQDKVLIDKLSDTQVPAEEITAYVSGNYLFGYWNKFDVVCTPCNALDSLFISGDNKYRNCYDYFNERINGGYEIKDQLYSTSLQSGELNYLACFDYGDSLSGSHKLFIEIGSKLFLHYEGYPTLLLDEKEISRSISLGKFSFARYNGGVLQDYSGTYNYPVKLTSERLIENLSSDPGKYGHVFSNYGEGQVLILSSQKRGYLEKITIFSFIFIGLSLVLFVLALFMRDLPLRYKYESMTIRAKIQVFLLLIVLVVFVPIGVQTAYYISSLYSEKNSHLISEKIESVLVELEHKVGAEKELTEEIRDYMGLLMVKFSNVFYTDINLYEPNGQLFASSRPQVFEQGLIGRQMDPEAYREMHVNHQSKYIVHEHIGALRFQSVYMPFRNKDNEVIAYLNVPSFAEQDELDAELSLFLGAMINSYILVLAFAVIVALLFADYVLRPVNLIVRSMSRLVPGEKNVLIEWKRNDEIGALVKEYNSMVLKLEESIAMLARSEREFAWREMAKQIAHEIKNPLTPMKLSIQHLQRAYKRDDPGLEDQLRRTADTLIEQIDNLNFIAGEFSNFARLSTGKKEINDVLVLLRNSVDLFGKEGSVKLHFETESNGPVNVLGDKDQLNSVFINLLKNAFQSIDPDSQGKVEVQLKVREDRVIVQVADNGIGIDEEVRDKIFMPNFTTKTSGMGLGLAIVKRIVDSLDGEISFVSQKGEGTTFTVVFPLQSDEN